MADRNIFARERTLLRILNAARDRPFVHPNRLFASGTSGARQLARTGIFSLPVETLERIIRFVMRQVRLVLPQQVWDGARFVQRRPNAPRRLQVSLPWQDEHRATDGNQWLQLRVQHLGNHFNTTYFSRVEGDDDKRVYHQYDRLSWQPREPRRGYMRLPENLYAQYREDQRLGRIGNDIAYTLNPLTNMLQRMDVEELD